MELQTIEIDDIRLYGFHGCLPQEAVIGAAYVIKVTLTADFSQACKSDLLTDTIDYVEVFNLVKEEFSIRSSLIEHVASRILNRIKVTFPMLTTAQVKITKLNPPMNGPVGSVNFIIHR